MSAPGKAKGAPTGPKPRPIELTIPRELVHQAVDKADSNRIRGILKQICDMDRTYAVHVSRSLVVMGDSAEYGTYEDEVDSDTSESLEQEREQETVSGTKRKQPEPSSTTSRKRTRHNAFLSRYEICINCEERFDVTENNAESCGKHSDQFRDALATSSVRSSHLDLLYYDIERDSDVDSTDYISTEGFGCSYGSVVKTSLKQEAVFHKDTLLGLGNARSYWYQGHWG